MGILPDFNVISRLLNSNDAETDEAPSWGESFDVRSDLVLWWNNLEQDSRYKRFSSSLQDLLMPSYPGQFKYIRKNIFNILFFADLSNLSHLNIIVSMFDLIERNIPWRFGVSCYRASQVSDKSAKAFYYLFEKGKCKALVKFVSES